jgi:hypothetical protein
MIKKKCLPSCVWCGMCVIDFLLRVTAQAVGSVRFSSSHSSSSATVPHPHTLTTDHPTGAGPQSQSISRRLSVSIRRAWLGVWRDCRWFAWASPSLPSPHSVAHSSPHPTHTHIHTSDHHHHHSAHTGMPAAAASSSSGAAGHDGAMAFAAQGVAAVLNKGASHANLGVVQREVEQGLAQERARAEEYLRQQHQQAPTPAMEAVQERLQVRVCVFVRVLMVCLCVCGWGGSGRPLLLPTVLRMAAHTQTLPTINQPTTHLHPPSRC